MNTANLIKIIREKSVQLDPIQTDVAPKVEPLPGMRAIVWDVYGTLFCSGSGDIGLAEAEDREGVFRRSLEEFGAIINPEVVVSFTDIFHTSIRRLQAQRAREGVDFPEVEIREVWEDTLKELDRRRAFSARPDSAIIPELALNYECQTNPVWPMPNLAETLKRIREAGLIMGIVSNAQFFTPLLFDALLGKNLASLGFDSDACVYSYQLRRAKPSVKLYEILQSKLKDQNIQPHQTLYVGNDMRNDIWPAKRAGFKTALFAGDQRSLRLREDDPDVAGIQPDRIITHVGQAADIMLDN